MRLIWAKVTSAVLHLDFLGEGSVGALLIRWLKEKELSYFVLCFTVDYFQSLGEGTCFIIY